MGDKPALIMMMGLPRSGKSTRAMREGHPIVCPDAIRLALHGNRFIGDAEPMVWAIARYMVHALFLAGHHWVILDACNVSRKRRDEWKDDERYNREAIVMIASQYLCARRSREDGSSGELGPVIERMAADWEDIDLAVEGFQRVQTAE